MTRYIFTQFPGRPPAPFVHVTVRGRGADPGDELADQPAQIDTAADRTVIPWAVVKHLGLAHLRRLDIAALGGVVAQFDTYAVEIEIRGLPSVVVEVIAADEPWILLGRDVTNHFKLFLDGPTSALEIS